MACNITAYRSAQLRGSTTNVSSTNGALASEPRLLIVPSIYVGRLGQDAVLISEDDATVQQHWFKFRPRREVCDDEHLLTCQGLGSALELFEDQKARLQVGSGLVTGSVGGLSQRCARSPLGGR